MHDLLLILLCIVPAMFTIPIGMIAGAGATNTAALRLNGSTQYASVSNASAGDLVDPGTSALTIEMWVKFDTLSWSNNTYLLAGCPSAGDGYPLVLDDSAGTKTLKLEVENAQGEVIEGVTWAPSEDTWYHIAATCEDIGNSTDITFFVDGSQQGSTQNNSYDGAINASVADFYIGYDEGFWSTLYFGGDIDDVRVWKEARTEAEISANKDKELTGSETNLVGYWKFNEDYTDETSNGNDLTGHNSPTFETSDLPF
jgi:hypothetical protein